VRARACVCASERASKRARPGALPAQRTSRYPPFPQTRWWRRRSTRRSRTHPVQRTSTYVHKHVNKQANSKPTIQHDPNPAGSLSAVSLVLLLRSEKAAGGYGQRDGMRKREEEGRSGEEGRREREDRVEAGCFRSIRHMSRNVHVKVSILIWGPRVPRSQDPRTGVLHISSRGPIRGREHCERLEFIFFFEMQCRKDVN
jgi:hypothetical protein